METREVRAHLDGSQPVGSAGVGNSTGANEAPGNARGSRAFPDEGLTTIMGQALGWRRGNI